MKKSLFITGAGNSGKTQLRKLTEMLIGSNACSSASISDIEARFGTANVYNKRLVGDADMSFMSIKELKKFKQITGGDSISIEFKGKTPFNYTFNGLMWFCMNQLPKFSGDRGQWVYDRITIIEANNVIPAEKRDPRLIDKLYEEREAIVYMCIIALKQVIAGGYKYDIPQACIDTMKQYQRDNSPVKTFFAECCTMREQENGKNIKDSCTTKKMYEVFKAWCKDNNGGYCLGIQEFNNELLELFELTETKQLYTKIMGTRYYIFTLSLEYKEYYKGIYGVDSVN